MINGMQERAEKVFETMDDLVNLAAAQNGISSITHMSDDELKALKITANLYVELKDLGLYQAKELDKMSDKLDELERMNRQMLSELDRLLSRKDKEP